jgi:hypothetical protein
VEEEGGSGHIYMKKFSSKFIYYIEVGKDKKPFDIVFT